ncbi:MAG: TRAP transporter small permease [Bacteroidetes bacterium]|nr:TRAP transporter small permease [Bacteroidota bacterium]
MNKSIRVVDRVITKIIEIILTVLFMMIFLMVFNQVILRYIFNTSIMGTAEVFTMLFTYTSALGAALMLRQREHIKIAVFIDKLSIKAKKIILTIDYLLIGLFCFYVFWESLPWLKSIKLFRSQVTGISRAVESIAIPIAFGLMVFYCIYNLNFLFFVHRRSKDY